MKEKENKQQVNKPSDAIEDLTLNETEAEDVKGGLFETFAKISDIKGELPPESPNLPRLDIKQT